jgi:hypothetical protein
MKDLFKCSQNGILKLIETYKASSIMRICLNYYLSLISNHLEEKNNELLFLKDGMTTFYTNENMEKLYTNFLYNLIQEITNSIYTFLLHN